MLLDCGRLDLRCGRNAVVGLPPESSPRSHPRAAPQSEGYTGRLFPARRCAGPDTAGRTEIFAHTVRDPQRGVQPERNAYVPASTSPSVTATDSSRRPRGQAHIRPRRCAPQRPDGAIFEDATGGATAQLEVLDAGWLSIRRPVSKALVGAKLPADRYPSEKQLPRGMRFPSQLARSVCRTRFAASAVSHPLHYRLEFCR